MLRFARYPALGCRVLDRRPSGIARRYLRANELRRLPFEFATQFADPKRTRGGEEVFEAARAGIQFQPPHIVGRDVATHQSVEFLTQYGPAAATRGRARLMIQPSKCGFSFDCKNQSR